MKSEHVNRNLNQHFNQYLNQHLKQQKQQKQQKQKLSEISSLKFPEEFFNKKKNEEKNINEQVFREF